MTQAAKPTIIDTPAAERRYFRHTTNGDRAYLVEDTEGRQFMRLDRPVGGYSRTGAADMPYTESTQSKWAEDRERRPVTEFQFARVAFEADKALCIARGDHEAGRRTWLGLKDHQRRLWKNRGPTTDPVRAELWQAIMGVLLKETDG